MKRQTKGIKVMRSRNKPPCGTLTCFTWPGYQGWNRLGHSNICFLTPLCAFWFSKEATSKHIWLYFVLGCFQLGRGNMAWVCVLSYGNGTQVAHFKTLLKRQSNLIYPFFPNPWSFSSGEFVKRLLVADTFNWLTDNSLLGLPNNKM